MKKLFFTKCTAPLLACLLLTAVLSAGCCCGGIFDAFKAKYERTVQVSSPITPGQTLEVSTTVGSIEVTGGDFTDCNVTAKIMAKASSEEEARKLAEETEIEFKSAGDRLKVEVERPPRVEKEMICVGFKITVPRQTALDLKANVGELEVDNITEAIEAMTNVGKITCKGITGRVDLTTNVGEVKVVYAEDTPAACNVEITTSVGEISFDGPDNLSAEVHASTNVGLIKTHLPLTVTGKIGKSLDGTVGAGEGKVILRTNVGSIKIK